MQILNTHNPNGTSQAIPTDAQLHNLLIYEVISMVVSILLSNAGIFFTFVLYLAGVADASLGSFKTRYRRAIRPLAMAYTPIAILQFIMTILAGIGFVMINNAGALTYISTLISSANPDFSQVGVYILLGALVAIPFSILFDAYIIALIVQGGNVGTGVNRWGVFGLGLAAGLTVGIVLQIFSSIVNIFVQTILLK